ncbi:MAG: cytochrome c [Candidatus Eisenbacteria bacterium]|nr:cytochrome c [Candidatus Eisenbacteria bacterium]
MSRSLIGVVIVGALMLMAASTARQGCKDVKNAWTHLDYYPIRDMRRTVVLNPQKVSTRPPDTLSVPVGGRDLYADYMRNPDHNASDLAAMLAERVTDPTEGANDSSLARGERKFKITCVPCHGPKMEANGPVAPMFMPPPDLLAQATRERKDGFIFSYIRHGGVVMPPYGAQVTAAEAWDLIHYIRHMQKVSPR